MNNNTNQGQLQITKHQSDFFEAYNGRFGAFGKSWFDAIYRLVVHIYLEEERQRMAAKTGCNKCTGIVYWDDCQQCLEGETMKYEIDIKVTIETNCDSCRNSCRYFELFERADGDYDAFCNLFFNQDMDDGELEKLGHHEFKRCPQCLEATNENQH